MKKRLLSFFLAMLTLLSMFPTAMAASSEDAALGEVNIYNGDYELGYLSINGVVRKQKYTYFLYEGNDGQQKESPAYADALSHATDVLESQQEFISALVDHLKEQHDQTELYDILHDTLGLADKDILALGIDLPQHKAYTPEVSAGRKKRRNGYDER